MRSDVINEMSNLTGVERKWGIDTWILEAFPIEKAILTLQEERFDYFEYSYEHFREDELKGTMASKIKNLLDVLSTFSIEALQMHAPYGQLDIQLGSSDEAIRSRGIEKAKEWVQYASLLGVKTIVFHTAWNKANAQLSTEKQLMYFKTINLQAFTKIGEYGKEVGVKIAVENRLEGTFGSRPYDLIDLVEQDPDNLGVCFDTGHANVNGFDCGDFVQELGEHLIATHVHDNDGRSDQHLLPYMGNINWELFFRAIKGTRYRGPLIVEVPGSSQDERLCLNKVKLTKHLLKIL